VRYYEVFVADTSYKRDEPLTYSYGLELSAGQAVTVPLLRRLATGFVLREAKKPKFATKDIKTVLSPTSLPPHCMRLAEWLKDYYGASLGEALRLFAPSAPIVRGPIADEKQLTAQDIGLELHLEQSLTADQQKALSAIDKNPSTTMLLHGDTGTGKTRVYLELARRNLNRGRSVMVLTPEIALTSQLEHVFASQLAVPVYVLHSQLTASRRKKIWLAILETKKPVVIIGPRSALFSPVRELGLVVVDEAHEPTYKQEQTPHYHAVRVASQLGKLTGAKVILGTATPTVADYYVAEKHGAVARMTKPALSNRGEPVNKQVVDIKDRTQFTRDPHLSNALIDAVSQTLAAKKQAIIYLNRRGSARLILCNKCGWQSLCPNCDIPLVYHADEHQTRCHVCGYKTPPPHNCPACGNPDIIYKSIGTKALMDSAAKLFPGSRIQRFDSDNVSGERIHEVYHQLRRGEIDILVGTQLLAKGFDLPKLGMVGIVAGESSMSLPDFASEERSFQLLYQVMGRVGRGHGRGRVVLQTYEPNNIVVQAAVERDYMRFYNNTLDERRRFRFPPFSYLLKLSCRRATYNSAQAAAEQLAKQLAAKKLPIEIIGPAPSFYGRRGSYYSWQIVVKSKRRGDLQVIALSVPANWSADLDPADLL
jgi:primosomal protein N' (replication factor Y)